MKISGVGSSQRRWMYCKSVNHSVESVFIAFNVGFDWPTCYNDTHLLQENEIVTTPLSWKQEDDIGRNPIKFGQQKGVA